MADELEALDRRAGGDQPRQKLLCGRARRELDLEHAIGVVAPFDQRGGREGCPARRWRSFDRTTATWRPAVA